MDGFVIGVAASLVSYVIIEIVKFLIRKIQYILIK